MVAPRPDETPMGSGAVTEPTNVIERNMNIPTAKSAVDKGWRLMLRISVMPGVSLSRILSPASPRKKHIMNVMKLRMSTQARLVRNTAGSNQMGGNDSAKSVNTTLHLGRASLSPFVSADI